MPARLPRTVYYGKTLLSAVSGLAIAQANARR